MWAPPLYETPVCLSVCLSKKIVRCSVHPSPSMYAFFCLPSMFKTLLGGSRWGWFVHLPQPCSDFWLKRKNHFILDIPFGSAKLTIKNETYNRSARLQNWTNSKYFLTIYIYGTLQYKTDILSDFFLMTA